MKIKRFLVLLLVLVSVQAAQGMDKKVVTQGNKGSGNFIRQEIAHNGDNVRATSEREQGGFGWSSKEKFVVEGSEEDVKKVHQILKFPYGENIKSRSILDGYSLKTRLILGASFLTGIGVLGYYLYKNPTLITSMQKKVMNGWNYCFTKSAPKVAIETTPFFF